VTFRTTIIRILSDDEKKKRYTLLLSGGDLHPAGGGQPGDSGRLWGEDFLFTVTETEKHGEGISVSGRAERGKPAPGMEVEGETDLGRHALLSRMHTGEHILSRALEKSFPGLRVYKVAVDCTETSVYLTWDGDLGWDMLFAAEKEGNGIIAENRPVETVFLSREDAEKIPGIKGNWDRIEDETIRVVQIPGFDIIACSGSHVSSTGEVGDLFVTGYRGTAPDWEIKFTVNGTEMRREYSEAARRLVRRIGCRMNQLENVFAGLQEENGALGKMLDRAAQFLSLPITVYECGGYSIGTCVLPGFSRELVAVPASKWSEAHPGAVCIILIPDHEGKNGSFLLYRGKSIPRDFSLFLKETPSLSGRGGGRADWLNGVSPVMSSEAWIEAVKEYMNRRP